MSFSYPRQIRFHETDAAGVVYFSHVLTLCHEAYEASLAEADIDLRQFFSPAGGVAVPIVHADVDFFRPLHCGDRLRILLTPQRIEASEFELRYQLLTDSLAAHSIQQPSPKLLAKACTRHVCISTHPRQRIALPTELEQWLKSLEA